MQNRRLLAYDAETLTEVWHTYDDVTDTTVIEEIQDIEPIIARNMAIQNQDPGGALGLNEYSRKGIKESWWHVATIPTSVQLLWRRQYGVNVFLWNKCDWTKRKIRKLLNSREWAHLRTGTGRV